MEIKKLLVGCSLGGLSGLVCTAILFSQKGEYTGFLTNFLLYGVGFVFGLITVGYVVYPSVLKKEYLRTLSQAILWFLACGLGYFSAVMVFMREFGDETFSLGLAGLVGAALITGAYHLFIKKLSRKTIFFCLFGGAVLAFFGQSHIFYNGRFSLLFILWQAGVFGLLVSEKNS